VISVLDGPGPRLICLLIINLPIALLLRATVNRNRSTTSR
jgi:hypothetical protein